jgi:flagellar hook-length control protein FliK
MDSTALAETGQATGANGVSNAGSDLKSSGASTVTQGTMDSTALAETGQATGALSQSNQDSGMTGHSKETQVKDTSFVKPVSALETQQPQESAPQSPSGSEGMNNLLAQSSLQQHDLSSLTGLGQTTDSKSPTLGASVINQIVASANLAVNNDNASMSIQLKPEWLGDLKLVVDVEQGVVNAHFITQNQVTASLIQARLPELKQALNDQGISWQHLSVSSGAGQGSNQGASSQSQQNLNQSQTQYDYGSGDSTDSDAPPTIPVDYQWAGTGAFNYVV